MTEKLHRLYIHRTWVNMQGRILIQGKPIRSENIITDD